MSTFKYYKNGKWNIVNGQITGDTLPIGAIVPFGGWDAPTGWLICDGTLLNKTDYPELFNAIGYSFGGEEGGSTFGLPDLRGRVPLGLKETDTDFNGMGLTGGSKDAVVVSHTHSNTNNAISWVGNSGLGNTNWLAADGKQVTYSTIANPNDGAKAGWMGNGNAVINSTGVSGAGKNLQPYQVVCYIIKADQSAGLVANVVNQTTTSSTDTYSCDYLNNLLQITTETITIGTINAGSGLYDQTRAITIPQGYAPISIAGYSIAGGSSASINVARLQINGTNIEYSLFNAASSGSSANTSTLNVKVLFVKETN